MTRFRSLPAVLVAFLAALHPVHALRNTTHLQHASRRPGQAWVHLFEWPWSSVADECENFLGPAGYSAVQISPPQEHIPGEPWWTRYQPVSYKLESRGGSRAELHDMIKRCANVGVAVLPDAVINHMAADQGLEFPGVPFGAGDFHHPRCAIHDWHSRHQVQYCDLLELPDLFTGKDYVQHKIAEYMNDLIDLGVRGFRVDAVKHMAAQDVGGIKRRLHNVDQVYFCQEVIQNNDEPIRGKEYVQFGDVTEFNWPDRLSSAFKRDLRWLQHITGDMELEGHESCNFVANHDTERQNSHFLNYKDGRLYVLAEIFTLAHPFGFPKVMSGYHFSGHDQGPPSERPYTYSGAAREHSGPSEDAWAAGTWKQTNGSNSMRASPWVYQHRWGEIAAMVRFRNVAAADSSRGQLGHWHSDGSRRIAFARRGRGFVAINAGEGTWTAAFTTTLPSGRYCNVLAGHKQTRNAPSMSNEASPCTAWVDVRGDGTATVSVESMHAVAIHV